METAQPGQGLELMLYGMGMVVLFLVVLVYATRLLSALTRRYFPEPAPAPAAARRPPVAASGAGVGPGMSDETIDPILVAAITAAVHAHRQRSGV